MVCSRLAAASCLVFLTACAATKPTVPAQPGGDAVARAMVRDRGNVSPNCVAASGCAAERDSVPAGQIE